MKPRRPIRFPPKRAFMVCVAGDGYPLTMAHHFVRWGLEWCSLCSQLKFRERRTRPAVSDDPVCSTCQRRAAFLGLEGRSS